MFLYAGRLLFAWGAGQSGTPPPPPSEGPYWVSNYHAVGIRCYMPKVREVQVLPGRVWSPDPSLMVFAWSEDD